MLARRTRPMQPAGQARRATIGYLVYNSKLLSTTPELFSPTVQEDSAEVASSSTEKEDARKKGNSLKRCSCESSSSGKAWLLKCNSCTQFWHNSCANLKGKLQKSTIDQLDHSLCPWCFVPPYKAPKNHKSVKYNTTLTDNVASDSFIVKLKMPYTDTLFHKVMTF